MTSDGGSPTDDEAASIDAIVQSVWEDSQNDECDGTTWALASDQWFVVTVRCGHGAYEAASNGPVDPTRAFERAAGKWKAAHGG